MKAFILAAGRGQRLSPLTNKTPKPLLPLAGKPLIIHHIERLAQAGIQDIVINVSYLAEKIIKTLGTGKTWNTNIIYSHEPTALESGGGIMQALPLLGSNPFIIISADIYTNYPFENLLKTSLTHSAHLVLASHPECHADFHLKNGLLYNTGAPKYTYANIGLYDPAFFSNPMPAIFPLGNLLRPAIDKQHITGELYEGLWENVTSPMQYEKLCQRFKN